MSRPASRTSSTTSSSSALAAESSSAMQTLRVMRLQSPELHQSFAGSLSATNDIESALCLPDSLGVYVGETFTAYLGLLNASQHATIRKLGVSVLLQTPSQRWQLPSPLDPNTGGGADVGPNSNIDAIVSHDIQEPGPHILRVEVSYLTTDGSTKTFRKFYRFQVVSPIVLSSQVVRAGDAACFVSVHVQWAAAAASESQAQTQQPPPPKEQLLISDVVFEPQAGLVATNIGVPAIRSVSYNNHQEEEEPCSSQGEPSAVQLWDQLTLLTSDSNKSSHQHRYLFKVQAASNDAMLKGLAAGDVLGRAVVTWRKSMGEAGRIPSNAVVVPPVQQALRSNNNDNFCVYNSGLSVDLAAMGGAASSSKTPDMLELQQQFPVTVEPLDPPAEMTLHKVQSVDFLIVNHTHMPMNLQLQFDVSSSGLAVCGTSRTTLGEVPPNGGSKVASVRFLPLAAGLYKCEGCCVVDIVTQREIPMPALFQTFVTTMSAMVHDNVVRETSGASMVAAEQ